MKTVSFIIPGYKHSPYRKIYKDIIYEFEKKGIRTIPVNITWKYKTMSQWVEEFINIYNKNKTDTNIFFGFSYGAMIAFLASLKVPVDTLILCSLSPYFQEDLPKLPRYYKRTMGKRRFADFQNIKASNLTPQIKASTILLYGTKEFKDVQMRAKNTFNKLNTKKKLNPVEGSKHNIGNKQYLNEIRKVINNLQY
jgi:pimeloyl-ACP methyl ester carboxylesterase